MTFEKRQKWSVVVEIRTIVASGGQGKGWTGKENFSEVMEIFYVLIWVLLVFICQHSLNCILKICAFDFLNYTSIKKNSFPEWTTLSEYHAFRLNETIYMKCLKHWVSGNSLDYRAVITYTSVTIFSSCLSCFSMYSFLVNIVLEP